MFLGFYLDLDEVFADAGAYDVNHTLSVTLPTLNPGQFKGVFLENVQTEYTTEVEACRMLN